MQNFIHDQIRQIVRKEVHDAIREIFGETPAASDQTERQQSLDLQTDPLGVFPLPRKSELPAAYVERLIQYMRFNGVVSIEIPKEVFSRYVIKTFSNAANLRGCGFSCKYRILSLRKLKLRISNRSVFND